VLILVNHLPCSIMLEDENKASKAALERVQRDMNLETLETELKTLKEPLTDAH